MAGLYIHVPFCLKKCAYCDFASQPGTTAEFDLYLDALEIEFTQLPDNFAPETVYIGGGTPTVLPDTQLKRLLALTGNVENITEWTCEANPGTLTSEKIEILRKAGVNRVSLGVQSFSESVLTLLERIHNIDAIKQSVDLLRKSGFENISLDLMFAVPNETLAILENDLQQLLEFKPEHVSCYALSFEPGTKLYTRLKQGLITELEPELQADQYEFIRNTLIKNGYEHYEISNFAKPDRECKHNLNYWQNGEYFGLGPAAHSHWNKVRYVNTSCTAEYCQKILAGKSARVFQEKLEPEHKIREALITGLRCLKGVEGDYRKICGDKISELCAAGFLIEKNGRLMLTPKAYFVSNSIFSELV